MSKTTDSEASADKSRKLAWVRTKVRDTSKDAKPGATREMLPDEVDAVPLVIDRTPLTADVAKANPDGERSEKDRIGEVESRQADTRAKLAESLVATGRANANLDAVGPRPKVEPKTLSDSERKEKLKEALKDLGGKRSAEAEAAAETHAEEVLDKIQGGAQQNQKETATGDVKLAHPVSAHGPKSNPAARLVGGVRDDDDPEEPAADEVAEEPAVAPMNQGALPLEAVAQDVPAPVKPPVTLKSDTLGEIELPAYDKVGPEPKNISGKFSSHQGMLHAVTEAFAQADQLGRRVEAPKEEAEDDPDKALQKRLKDIPLSGADGKPVPGPQPDPGAFDPRSAGDVPFVPVVGGRSLKDEKEALGFNLEIRGMTEQNKGTPLAKDEMQSRYEAIKKTDDLEAARVVLKPAFVKDEATGELNRAGWNVQSAYAVNDAVSPDLSILSAEPPSDPGQAAAFEAKKKEAKLYLLKQERSAGEQDNKQHAGALKQAKAKVVAADDAVKRCENEIRLKNAEIEKLRTKAAGANPLPVDQAEQEILAIHEELTKQKAKHESDVAYHAPVEAVQNIFDPSEDIEGSPGNPEKMAAAQEALDLVDVQLEDYDKWAAQLKKSLMEQEVVRATQERVEQKKVHEEEARKLPDLESRAKLAADAFEAKKKEVAEAEVGVPPKPRPEGSKPAKAGYNPESGEYDGDRPEKPPQYAQLRGKKDEEAQTAHHIYPWNKLCADLNKALGSKNAAGIKNIFAFGDVPDPGKDFWDQLKLEPADRPYAFSEVINKAAPLICWSPRNVFMGPLGEKRGDDPKEDLDQAYTDSGLPTAPTAVGELTEKSGGLGAGPAESEAAIRGRIETAFLKARRVASLDKLDADGKKQLTAELARAGVKDAVLADFLAAKGVDSADGLDDEGKAGLRDALIHAGDPDAILETFLAERKVTSADQLKPEDAEALKALLGAQAKNPRQRLAELAARNVADAQSQDTRTYDPTEWELDKDGKKVRRGAPRAQPERPEKDEQATFEALLPKAEARLDGVRRLAPDRVGELPGLLATAKNHGEGGAYGDGIDVLHDLQAKIDVALRPATADQGHAPSGAKAKPHDRGDLPEETVKVRKAEFEAAIGRARLLQDVLEDFRNRASQISGTDKAAVGLWDDLIKSLEDRVRLEEGDESTGAALNKVDAERKEELRQLLYSRMDVDEVMATKHLRHEFESYAGAGASQKLWQFYRAASQKKAVRAWAESGEVDAALGAGRIDALKRDPDDPAALGDAAEAALNALGKAELGGFAAEMKKKYKHYFENIPIPKK